MDNTTQSDLGNVLVSQLNQRFRQYLTDRLVACWRAFIRGLPFSEVSDERLEQVASDYCGSAEQSYQAFHLWCKSNPKARWGDIREVLQRMGENQLVTNCEKYYEHSISTDEKNFNSERIIESAAEALREFYRKKYRKVEQIVHNSPYNKFVDRDTVYVDLKINRLKNENREQLVDRDYYISQRNNDDENIKTTDFFKDDKRPVVVSGIAGIGKTTLAINSLMQWVERKQWNEFDFVFYIPCREVNFLKNCNSVDQLLKERFPFVMDKIATWRGIADRTLILIDGIDEFRFVDDLVNITMGVSEVEPIAQAFHGMLNQAGHPVKYGILVVGRPEAASKMKRMMSSDEPLCVDVLGLDDGNIKQFIRNRVGDNAALKSRIEDTIARSPSMQIMATVPIYLEVMCSILENNNDTTFSTITELYTWVLFYYIQKHFKNFKGESRFIHISIHELFCDTDVMETLDYVCKMAYLMLKEGRIVFNSKTFGSIPGGTLEFSGLISKVKLSQLEDVYELKHLSLMEFCSALYIFKNLSDDVDSVMNDPRLKGCIPVVCGLGGALNNNADTPHIVEMLVEALKLEPRPSSWLNCVLERNEETTIDNMSDRFLASFFEARSPIPQQYERHFTRTYGYVIDDGNAIRCSQELYFADQLMKAGCLNIGWLGVDCGKQMSRDLQALMMKMICSAEQIIIVRLPVNFNGELFAQTLSQRSPSEPPIELLIYNHHTMKTFRMSLPVMDVVEGLTINLLIACSVDETIEIINKMKTMKSLKRITINDFVGANKQHERLYEVMGEELEGLGKEVELGFG